MNWEYNLTRSVSEILYYNVAVIFYRWLVFVINFFPGINQTDVLVLPLFQIFHPTNFNKFLISDKY